MHWCHACIQPDHPATPRAWPPCEPAWLHAARALALTAEYASRAGYIVQSFLRFPGYLSPTSGVKFAEIPNGIAGLAAVPPAGLLQILLFIGCAPPTGFRPRRSDRLADAHSPRTHAG